MKIQQIVLFEIPISVTSKQGVLAEITRWVEKKSLIPRVVVTPNPEIIVAAQKNPALLRALQQADASIADGWGVVAALRLLNSKVQRIAGIELMESLVEKAVHEGWKVMLVGGKPGIAVAAAEKLRVFGLQGPEDIFCCSQEEMNKLIISINRFKPDLLFVAFGPGRQEVWMEKWRQRLSVGVMMGVGGAFDQIVDPTLRPPDYIDSIGLGWLYRLVRQPGRWRRQLKLIAFLKMVIMAKMAEWLQIAS